ncbi:hypothetical protein ACIBKY_30960 [Nonomuraea sp. NPDC050394]|uniref:hypothetical protein n=1 Tax=Nonomuraea sp. NPDC050394 TaxID=3364363 RepID=UPI003794E5D2
MPRSYDRWSDERLLGELARALRAGERVPPETVAAGRAVFAWRAADAELAGGDPDGRIHHVAGLTIELEIAADTLVVRLTPAQPAEVEARGPRLASHPATPVEKGRFTIRPLPRFPFYLLCRTAGGRKVVTGWILG